MQIMLPLALPDWDHAAARGAAQERVRVGGGGHDFKGGCLLVAEGQAGGPGWMGGRLFQVRDEDQQNRDDKVFFCFVVVNPRPRVVFHWFLEWRGEGETLM